MPTDNPTSPADREPSEMPPTPDAIPASRVEMVDSDLLLELRQANASAESAERSAKQSLATLQAARTIVTYVVTRLEIRYQLGPGDQVLPDGQIIRSTTGSQPRAEANTAHS